VVDYFKRLLSVIRLGYEEVANIDTKLLGIEPVKSMFCINECGYAACFLSLGNGMDSAGGRAL